MSCEERPQDSHDRSNVRERAPSQSWATAGAPIPGMTRLKRWFVSTKPPATASKIVCVRSALSSRRGAMIAKAAMDVPEVTRDSVRRANQKRAARSRPILGSNSRFQGPPRGGKPPTSGPGSRLVIRGLSPGRRARRRTPPGVVPTSQTPQRLHAQLPWYLTSEGVAVANYSADKGLSYIPVQLSQPWHCGV